MYLFGRVGVVDAEAFFGVLPAWVDAGEEVFAWYDENAFGFESGVELVGGDGHVFTPEPEEEGAFAGVEVVWDVWVAGLMEGLDGSLGSSFVEGVDDMVAEVVDMSG